MRRDDVVKVLVKADNSIIINYDISQKTITEAYYGDENLCPKGFLSLKEFIKILEEKNGIVIDEKKVSKTISEAILKNDTFNFPDVYRDTNNMPVKLFFKGGKVDDNNIVITVYKEKDNTKFETDPLTKCYPYETFKKHVEELIENHESFILGMLDIDNFKEFNSKYNRILGDIVLIETASTAKEFCGNRGILCRNGGDEFLFYIKMDNDYDLVHKCLTEMKLKIEKAINEIINVPEKITITIGISRAPHDGDRFNLLLAKTESALIRGKKKARDCFIIYLVEKCGFVDENTTFEKRIDNSDLNSANISVLTGILEILNLTFDLRKRIEDSISLIGTFFYLDRIIVTLLDHENVEINDVIPWYNPRSEKKPYKFSKNNIRVWKSIYEKSNLLVVNNTLETEYYALKEILNDSNISACVAIELKYNNRLFGQIRFEMTTVGRNWQSSVVSSFVLIAKILSIKLNKEYDELIHYKEMFYDRTTDIFNLRKWLDSGENYIKNNNYPVYSVLDIEIRDFNNILNAFGAKMASNVLITIANYLKTLEANHKEIIFGRTYDNRFSLLFPHKNINDMEIIFSELKDYVNTNIRLEKGNVILQAGIFINEENLALSEALDRTAIARRFGSDFNKPVVFDMTMYEKEMVRLELESHIENALNNNEFILYLQPKIYPKDKKLAGAEALTRWNYNFEKLVYPNTFIPLLEKNGFITKLDYIVFENVCKLQRNLLAKGLKTVPISVNVSRSVNDFDSYLENIERIRSKYKVPQELFEIEITEGMYTDNNEVIKNFISKLHKKGYKVSMDDFGSGNSNLTALSQLSFDTIKFDKSFFTSPDNEKEVLIIYVMSKLVKSLNMKVLCEGIETEEYDKYLTEIGIDYIQGYYYDKPLPVDIFLEKYIKK